MALNAVRQHQERNQEGRAGGADLIVPQLTLEIAMGAQAGLGLSAAAALSPWAERDPNH